MRSLFVAVLLLCAGAARADVTRRAGFLRYVIGTGIAQSVNVSSVANPSAGVYTVTLTQACDGTAGYAFTGADDGATKCQSAVFTSASVITITCRLNNDTPNNVTNGRVLSMLAYCAVP